MSDTLSPGAKAAFTVWGAAITWDLLCGPGQTISEVVAGGINDRRTRPLVLIGIAVHVLHVLLMAARMGKKP